MISVEYIDALRNWMRAVDARGGNVPDSVVRLLGMLASSEYTDGELHWWVQVVRRDVRKETLRLGAARSGSF